MGLLTYLKLGAIAALVLLFFFLYADLQAKKSTIVMLEGDKEELQQINTELGKKLITLSGIIETLKANLVAAKKSITEMQKVKDEANVLRRKLIELQNQPNACNELKVEYEKIASDITSMFNTRVRGKVNRPSTDSDRTAPEVLPSPVAPDTGRPQGNAGASG